MDDVEGIEGWMDGCGSAQGREVIELVESICFNFDYLNAHWRVNFPLSIEQTCWAWGFNLLKISLACCLTSDRFDSVWLSSTLWANGRASETLAIWVESTIEVFFGWGSRLKDRVVQWENFVLVLIALQFSFQVLLQNPFHYRIQILRKLESSQLSHSSLESQLNGSKFKDRKIRTEESKVTMIEGRVKESRVYIWHRETSSLKKGLEGRQDRLLEMQMEWSLVSLARSTGHLANLVFSLLQSAFHFDRRIWREGRWRKKIDRFGGEWIERL